MSWTLILLILSVGIWFKCENDFLSRTSRSSSINYGYLMQEFSNETFLKLPSMEASRLASQAIAADTLQLHICHTSNEHGSHLKGETGGEVSDTFQKDSQLNCIKGQAYSSGWDSGPDTQCETGKAEYYKQQTLKNLEAFKH